MAIITASAVKMVCFSVFKRLASREWQLCRAKPVRHLPFESRVMSLYSKVVFILFVKKQTINFPLRTSGAVNGGKYLEPPGQ
ncbi:MULTISPECIES: hypothetical protein [Serratia]|uniref:hypothetical protein n=1 Tax=Serratia TaxID=613 RepID=UPI001013C5B9|nr:MULTISPECIES: hypothetical protein [Serratia]